MKLRNLLLVLVSILLFIGASCPPNPVPSPTPSPFIPPESEWCVNKPEGQRNNCWDQPPGESWQYVCADGITRVSEPSLCCNPSPVPTPSPSSSPTPNPIPTPSSSCPDPPVWGNPVGFSTDPAVVRDNENTINTAMTQLGYVDGQILNGDCNIAAENFYTVLQQQVRLNGRCAYHAPDAFHIVLASGGKALDHHMINFGGCKLRFASNENYKGDWIVNASGPIPTPSPSATPTPNACRTTSVGNFRNIVKPHSGQQVDFTVVACGGDVVATNNNCGTQCCELSAEKGNQACSDKLFGMPTWTAAPGINLVQVNPENTFTMKVASGSGQIVVCGNFLTSTPGNCVSFQGSATVPACTVIPNSNQGCAVNR